MVSEFYSKGYEVVRNMISKDLANEQFQKALTIRGTQFTDTQVPNSQAFYNTDTFRSNHDLLHPMMEKITGLELFKTYYYWRKYSKGALLRFHRDREACEISVTLHLGGDPWKIWLLDLDENAISVDLKPGDGLIYKGCQLAHWRGKFNGNMHVQTFYHFVDKYGPSRFQMNDQIERGRLQPL